MSPIPTPTPISILRPTHTYPHPHPHPHTCPHPHPEHIDMSDTSHMNVRLVTRATWLMRRYEHYKDTHVFILRDILNAVWTTFRLIDTAIIGTWICTTQVTFICLASIFPLRTLIPCTLSSIYCMLHCRQHKGMGVTAGFGFCVDIKLFSCHNYYYMIIYHVYNHNFVRFLPSVVNFDC